MKRRGTFSELYRTGLDSNGKSGLSGTYFSVMVTCTCAFKATCAYPVLPVYSSDRPETVYTSAMQTGTPQTTSERAADWLRSVADMVIEKGKSYGDSIGSPVRIFSKAGAKDGLQVRIDDKLSRIAKGSEFQGDDTLKDLVGYLALLATDNEKQPGESPVRPGKHGPGLCWFGKPVIGRWWPCCEDLDCGCENEDNPDWATEDKRPVRY